MTSVELENLVGIGTLQRETAGEAELTGLRQSGESRLADAERADLSFQSRFDLSYNAAHALALCALRRLGYRTDRRYVVFQVLPHTVGLSTGHWRVLAKAHERRNTAEYEGYLEHDERLLEDVIPVALQRGRTARLPRPTGSRGPRGPRGSGNECLAHVSLDVTFDAAQEPVGTEAVGR